MTTFISNARRELRLPLRLEAQLAVAGVGYAAHTEDVGASGCRLLAPLRLQSGARLRLLLVLGGTAAPLAVGGAVVWRQAGAGLRHGVSFDAADGPRAEAWFDGLLDDNASLLDLDLVPDRIPLGDRIYVARAPLEPTTVEELLVLRLAGRRASIADLRAALGSRWSRAQRALFALLNRGVVALERGSPGA